MAEKRHRRKQTSANPAHSQPTAFTAASMTAMLEWGSLVDHHEGLYFIVGLIGGGGGRKWELGPKNWWVMGLKNIWGGLSKMVGG